MPMATLAHEVGEHGTRLCRVFKHYVNQALENMDVSDVTWIALDETAVKRNKYITLFIDKDTKCAARIWNL